MMDWTQSLCGQKGNGLAAKMLRRIMVHDSREENEMERLELPRD